MRARASDKARGSTRSRRDNAAAFRDGADALIPVVEQPPCGDTTVAAGCDTHREPPATRAPVRRTITHRPTAFVPAPPTVAELLSGLGAGVRRVYLTGPRPGEGTIAGFRSWAFGELPAGWAHGGTGYLESAQAPALRYVSPAGVTVDVSRAAAWFGEGTYSAGDAGAAYDAARALVEARFRGCTLLATPATTGRELWRNEAPVFAPLSDELQELIRATAGQHRYDPTDEEMAARADAVSELPALYEYDARFSYPALAWGMPVGAPTRDTCDAFAGAQPARYRVTFTVPRTWSHLGILGVKEAGSRWRYPRATRARHTVWCDGAELALALAQGWRVTIHERILWARAKPLDKWARKLIAARESVRGTDRVSALVRAALRQTTIAAIGAFWGAPRAHTCTRPITEPRPRGAENLRAEGAHWVWTERDAGGWAELRHPEWAAAIWARQRVRCLDAPTGTAGVRAGALHVPAAEVVALRADAVYLTRRTSWPDDGAAGRFRLVRAVEHALPAPRSHTELLRARGSQ